MRKLSIILIISLFSLCACQNENSQDTTSTNTSCPVSPIKVVSTLNQWGSIAKFVGGECVDVTNIIKDGVDPHEYEPTAKDISEINNADYFIQNGLDVDTWASSTASKLPIDKVLNISVSSSAYIENSNPHLWFNIAAIINTYSSILDTLSQKPGLSEYIKDRSKNFDSIKKQLTDVSDSVITNFDNKKIGYFESLPVYIFFQTNIIDNTPKNFIAKINNESEPTTKDIKDFSDSIKSNKFDMIIYNKSELNKTTSSLLNLAKQNNVKVFGMDEAMPNNYDNLFDWYIDLVNGLNQEIIK